MFAKCLCFLSLCTSYSYYFYLQELLVANNELNLEVSAIYGIECIISIIVTTSLMAVYGLPIFNQITMGDLYVGILMFSGKILGGISLKFVSFPF